MYTSEGIAHKSSIYPMPTRMCGALVVLLWEWGQGREKVPWKAEVKGWLMMTSSTRASVGVGGVVTCSMDADVDEDNVDVLPSVGYEVDVCVLSLSRVLDVLAYTLRFPPCK